MKDFLFNEDPDDSESSLGGISEILKKFASGSLDPDSTRLLDSLYNTIFITRSAQLISEEIYSLCLKTSMARKMEKMFGSTEMDIEKDIEILTLYIIEEIAFKTYNCDIGQPLKLISHMQDKLQSLENDEEISDEAKKVLKKSIHEYTICMGSASKMAIKNFILGHKCFDDATKQQVIEKLRIDDENADFVLICNPLLKSIALTKDNTFVPATKKDLISYLDKYVDSHKE